MAQNELQEMISRYQKELLQYVRSSKQSSASPSATTPSAASPSVTNKSPVSPSVTNKSTPPEPTSRDLDQKYDQMNTDFDQIESDFDQIDGDFATEEPRGYFSAYPEDDIDQMSFPNIDAAQNPITAQNPSSVQSYSAPTVTTRSNPVAAATQAASERETEPQFIGFLEVTARTGDGAKPVEAALVIVSSTDEKGERLEFTALTDLSGTARLFNLPASNPANTESPDMPDRFILYNVSISKPGYFDMVSTGVPLIGGITSRQDFKMIPLPEGISSDTIEFDNTEPQDLN
ncbi:MAG: hypothetical protein IIW73_01770 [Clostridia bacterium]|nr:hypothetical protein [Clostridia bacterium]